MGLFPWMTDWTKLSTVFPALELALKLPRFCFRVTGPEPHYGKRDFSGFGNLQQLGIGVALVRFQAV
jgi:hypothetical protein